MLTVHIYRVRLRSVNGVTSTNNIAFTCSSLEEGSIEDTQFIDDATLMVLCSNASKGPSCMPDHKPHV